MAYSPFENENFPLDNPEDIGRFLDGWNACASKSNAVIAATRKECADEVLRLLNTIDQALAAARKEERRKVLLEIQEQINTDNKSRCKACKTGNEAEACRACIFLSLEALELAATKD